MFKVPPMVIVGLTTPRAPEKPGSVPPTEKTLLPTSYNWGSGAMGVFSRHPPCRQQELKSGNRPDLQSPTRSVPESTPYVGETPAGASDSHYHNHDEIGKRIEEEDAHQRSFTRLVGEEEEELEEEGGTDGVSENEADTGVESGPEDNNWRTPTGSVGVQGVTVRSNTTASLEAHAVLVNDAAAVEGTREGRGEDHTISPFTLAEEHSMLSHGKTNLTLGGHESPP